MVFISLIPDMNPAFQNVENNSKFLFVLLNAAKISAKKFLV